MITKNGKRLVTAGLCKTNSGYDTVAVLTNVQGYTRYLSNAQNGSNFPYGIYNSFTLAPNSAGISFGADPTPATEDDYNLKNTITSGLSVSCNVSYIEDEYGRISCKRSYFITNTSASSITINEIGFKQQHTASNTKNGTSAPIDIFLLDRTVLDSPVVIQPGENAVIDYVITPAA